MHRWSRVSSPALVVAVSASIAAAVAQAEEPAASQPTATALQEIVVTAQKRQERLHDVPMGVTAISSDELQKQNLVDFEDLQSKVPGLSVELIQPGQSRLAIRGQNVGSVGSTVTTYVDDSPFGSSNALANGSLLSGDFDTWDLQRVEVLRGPQGTLYGAGSEGGLLKYVTNAPDPARVAGAVELGVADIAHGEIAGSVKGMINQPITSTAAVRISGFYAGVPGYIDDPSLGKSDLNRGYREGMRASMLFQVTDNFSMRLNAYGQNLHTDGSPYVDVIGAAGTPQAPPANQLQPANGDYDQQRFIGEPSTFRYRIYSADLDWNLGWGHATSITSYGTSTSRQVLDATSVPIVPGVLTFGDVASSVTKVPTGVAETADLNVDKLTEELRLASATAQALEWQVGAFYTHEQSSLLQTLPTFFIPSQADTGLPSLESPTLDSLYREWAGFGQITYHFNPQWDLALGGRWSENKQSANETITGLLVPPQVNSGTSSDTDFTYSIAPRWHVTQDTMVYGRIATGYRPGGPNALPPAAAAAGVPTSYQSDSTTNYELGTRTILWDNRFAIDIAAFMIHWKKIQLLEVVNNFGINANGGTAESKGVEWTFALTPLNGLNFALTGAYIDPYLTSDAPAAVRAEGENVAGRLLHLACRQRLQWIRRRDLELCRLALLRLRRKSRRGRVRPQSACGIAELQHRQPARRLRQQPLDLPALLQERRRHPRHHLLHELGHAELRRLDRTRAAAHLRRDAHRALLTRGKAWVSAPRARYRRRPRAGPRACPTRICCFSATRPTRRLPRRRSGCGTGFPSAASASGRAREPASRPACRA